MLPGHIYFRGTYASGLHMIPGYIHIQVSSRIHHDVEDHDTIRDPKNYARVQSTLASYSALELFQVQYKFLGN